MGRRGEEFQQFFEAEFPRLYRLAYLISGSSSEAEDLAQEAMVRTFRAWDRIKDREHPAAYARTVMINHRRSLWRHRERAVAQTRTAPSSQELPTEDQVVLWQGIRDLPPMQRAAIVLRYFEDRTEVETASILECPIGTVKSHVRRGLARLRTGLADDAPATARRAEE